MTLNSPRSSEGFGKRGRVIVSPSPAEAPAAVPATTSTNMKWIGGGLAAVALVGLIGGGTGGGGLLGGILGGLLGKHLADRSAARTAPQSPAQTAKAPAPPAASTTVQLGGFGSTAPSGSGGFFSSGS